VPLRQAWLSSIDLKAFACQFTHYDPTPTSGASVSYAPGAQKACYSDGGAGTWHGDDERARFPTFGHDASAWPNPATSGVPTHNSGQMVLFALMEDGATAPWLQYTRDSQMLEEMCRAGRPDGIGFGVALVVNQHLCPQLIIGAQRADGGGCVTIPETQRGGCYAGYVIHPNAGPRWMTNGWPGDPLAYSYLAPNFNPEVMRTFFDSVIDSPTTPHHILFSVDQLGKKVWKQEVQERHASGLPFDDFVPRWALFIDGVEAVSSISMNQRQMAQYPNALTPPFDATNSDFNGASSLLHEPSSDKSTPSAQIPRLDAIITPTMRLHIATDGFVQNSWLVASQPPIDPNTFLGMILDTTAMTLLRRRNPLMNTHPLNAAVEMLALHGRSFSRTEALAHYSAGLPNRPPRILSTAASVLEDECGQLNLTSIDDDVERYGKLQSVSYAVVSTVYPLYSDPYCTTPVAVGDGSTYPALYYEGPANFHGAYGSAVLRAYDGETMGRPRTIALSIDPVVDGPTIASTSATTEALGTVAMTFAGLSADTPGGYAEIGYRVKIVSLPTVGRLFSGNPALGAIVSGPPLAVNDTTTGHVVFYESLHSVVSALTVAQTDMFSVRGVAPPGTNDDESPVVATGTVYILSALRPQTTTAVATEDTNSPITLRTFYTGSALNVQFQIVAQTDLTLYQSNGSVVEAGSEADPVVLTGPVVECPGESSNYKCTYINALPAANVIGRRLSLASTASFGYQVVADGVTSATVTVSVAIENILDPIAGFSCVAQYNFSREAQTVVFPLANGGLNFSDADGGGGEAGWAYVQVTTSSLVFTVDGVPGNQYTDPPLATQYQTWPEQAYDLVGYCPPTCQTQATSRSTAEGGYECLQCLTPTSNVRLVLSFSAVMAPNLVRSVLDSIVITTDSQGYVPSWTDSLVVTLIKYDNGTSFTESCTITLDAQAEPYFDPYASKGICYFHSSVDLLSRLIGLGVCTMTYWDGPGFYYLRTGQVAVGIFSRVYVAIFMSVLVLVILACCACACCCTGARVGKYVVDTVRLLRQDVDRRNAERRGPRVEANVVQTLCFYLSCAGCCGWLSGLCLPRRENDPSLGERLQRVAWYATCKLIPALKPADEPVGPTWSEWLWDVWSWLLCRGCGVFPSLAKRPPKTRLEKPDPVDVGLPLLGLKV
jgi:hypothetical protein